MYLTQLNNWTQPYFLFSLARGFLITRTKPKKFNPEYNCHFYYYEQPLQKYHDLLKVKVLIVLMDVTVPGILIFAASFNANTFQRSLTFISNVNNNVTRNYAM